MSSYRESDLIRALKIQLTTVNGYARMLEREIAGPGEPTPRQREYMDRLMQSIDKLQQTVQSYDGRRTTNEDDPGTSGQQGIVGPYDSGMATR